MKGKFTAKRFIILPVLTTLFLFEGKQISKNVMKIPVCIGFQKGAMGSERIVDLHFDEVARPGAIPAVRRDYGDRELVIVDHRPFNSLAVGRSYCGRVRHASTGIQ